MNALVELALVLAVLAMAVKLLLLNFWRAVLFLFPASVRVRPEAPADRMELPPGLAALAGQLGALGFVPLGRHVEKPRFQKGTRSYDFAHPGERVFATLHLAPDGHPRLYLLTPLAPEGFVLTAGYKRPGFEVPGRYRSGSLVEAPPERLLQAHQERLQGLTPAEHFTWEERLQAGQAWYQGPGQREIRRQNLQGLLWTVVALAIVAGLFLGGGRSA
ncbi:hypothetical protein [Vitiosangium sp. GDMCC 1.1324]|uniref:hypothetical protein n=1 Tax=Vitiosangium sp. (strain GDMCC 1.1324) TaxID=2138576 RepID=UPI000D359A97|nr:hypothetical protein [Vitiosangium sp. GDMCC 1.1324]PTL83779.1 hypothetical protein DAT35_09915 [Vitiosangium sp. GDMCC 1.1324]